MSMISFKKGDWYCSDCHLHNFAKRDTCFKCQSEKSADAQTVQEGDDQQQQHKHSHPYSYAKGTRARKGDWHCPNTECHSVNFASRKSCFSCQTEKPPQPDEWECEQCGFQNKDFRVECMECGWNNPKPANRKVRKGEWHCNCGHFNFSKREQCQKCNGDKPIASDTPEEEEPADR